CTSTTLAADTPRSAANHRSADCHQSHDRVHLARDHGVSRGAIRTAVADLLPEHTANEEGFPVPELPVTLDIPGQVADCLRATELDDVERAAHDQGVTIRRGHGYTLRVSAVPAVHRQLFTRAPVEDNATHQQASAVKGQPGISVGHQDLRGE
ncbi:hypothetical protein ACH4B9_39895, partial [Streptomyces collinus]